MRRAERKKYLAGLIAVVLLSAIMPITALAASAGYGDFLVTGDDLSGVSFENNMLKIDTSGTYTISMAQEGTTTGPHSAVSPGVKATLVLNGVSVSSARREAIILSSAQGQEIPLSMCPLAPY